VGVAAVRAFRILVRCSDRRSLSSENAGSAQWFRESREPSGHQVEGKEFGVQPPDEALAIV